MDPKDPARPKTTARVAANGRWGAFNNGRLAVVEGTQLKTWKIVDGVPGVDEGECESVELKLSMAMDGRRLGQDDIDMDDPKNHEYLFWVNDDVDVIWTEFDAGAMLYQNHQDDQPSGFILNVDIDGQNPYIFNGDWKDNVIFCERDLEDFTRVHVRMSPGLARLGNVTISMKFENITSSTEPSVRMYKAIGKGLQYLTNPEKASAQIAIRDNTGVIGSREVQIPKEWFASELTPFILEGCTPGKGDLVIVVKQGGIEIERSKVTLDLRSPSDFCRKYEVKAISDDEDTVEANPRCINHVGYSYTPITLPSGMSMTKQVVVFAHGWNMGGYDSDQWEKHRWVETVFKRLWWQGYKGQVVGFFWPTLGLTDFCKGEVRAWNSAPAFARLLEQLNQESGGEVRVLAHSMGNTVTAEALRIAPNKTVHTYIAAQAAISAHMWDNRIATPDGWDFIKTPDIYRYYPNGDPDNPESGPYLVGVANKVRSRDGNKGGVINYYNKEDFALVKGWELNNKMFKSVKNAGFGSKAWFYSDSDSNINIHTPGDVYGEWVPAESGQWILNRELLPSFMPDRNMIFSHIVQSRSKALGSLVNPEESVNGFLRMVDLQQPPYNFDNHHYCHSRQFRSYLANEWPFWFTLYDDFGLRSE